ncbi:hypothetical protein [Streptomyces sp. NPDC005017]|uniref:hypothetical protein n=1 Tax=Streptomyces sp. NPDC005017 TaxID=3364706 RepID=UPI0036CC15F5
MHEDTYRGGQSEDETSLYHDRGVWRGVKVPSSAKRDKYQKDLDDWFQWLRAELQEDLRQQSRFLVAQTRNRADGLRQALDALADRLDGVDRKLDGVDRKVDRLLDALRDQGVRNAIDDGRATSDKHRRHLELAQKYQTLVRQDLLVLGRLLCPKGEDGTDLTRRRAQVVAQLVEQLFHPLDEPMSKQSDDVLGRLTELGHETEAAQFRGLFGAVFRKAAELRGTVAGLPLTAELDFAVDVSVLPADEYQVWNPSPGEGMAPEFLVAPAYRVGGERPQPLSTPFVFVAPAVTP